MTTPLPWDRFPEEELPYVEPVPASAPAPAFQPPPVVATPIPTGNYRYQEHFTPPQSVDWEELLDGAWPAIKDQVITYARDSAKAVVSGHTVDILHPTVVAEDVTGRELVIADAKSRSWRTLAQGLIFDVLFAIVAAITTLSGMDPFVTETWIAFGILLVKSVVSAVISYVMRLKVTPTMRTEGEKFAIAPLPRPMLDEEGNTHDRTGSAVP